MSYTPKTWVTGDDLDATSMNHIEQGIVGAESSGGGGSAVVEWHAEEMPSGTRTYAFVVYAINDAGEWFMQTNDEEDGEIIAGFTIPFKGFSVVPMPSNENVRPFILNAINGVSVVTTGDISDTPTTLYYLSGSACDDYDAYCINGDGSFLWDNR